MKIVKHCHESLPHMVTGSLLGLMVGSTLEITHAFPLPNERRSDQNAEKGSDDDHQGGGATDAGHDFQLEMMRMLREVNVDNNCVGWYQSMYLGIYSTSSLLENQLNYQEGLSANAVVILYDPMQTSHGNLVLKCYRLTEECVKLKESGSNDFIDPKNIFEEVPVKLINPSLVQALLVDVKDGVYDVSAAADKTSEDEGRLCSSAVDMTFDRLDLSTNPYLEKHLEFLCGWVDELSTEQQKFQYYSRQLSRGKNKPKNTAEAWASSDAPRRMESLLISNQIVSYCDQMNTFTSGGLGKLYLMGSLHKQEKSGAPKKN
jgi:translation initiation factor 3 subunit H